MMTSVCLVQNNEPFDEAVFQFLLKFSPPEKQQRILRQRIKQNAVNMAIGGALARYMLWKKFGITPDAKIAYGEFGKPYLPDYPEAHFNISHSGQFVVCAVCDSPVGVDVQEITPYRTDIATKVCSNTELAQIEATTNQAAGFTKIWTMKEATAKVKGLGFGNDLTFKDVSNSEIYSIHIGNIFISISRLMKAE